MDVINVLWPVKAATVSKADSLKTQLDFYDPASALGSKINMSDGFSRTEELCWFWTGGSGGCQRLFSAFQLWFVIPT